MILQAGCSVVRYGWVEALMSDDNTFNVICDVLVDQARRIIEKHQTDTVDVASASVCVIAALLGEDETPRFLRFMADKIEAGDFAVREGR